MDKNNMIPVEQILFANYIKYDRLTELVENTFRNSNDNIVNIFIDLYSMSRNIHLNKTFTSENKLVFASSMINLCAHLRNFFRKRYRVETNFFLVYSNNIPEYNRKLWLGYNSTHEKVLYRGNNDTTQYLLTNLKVLKLICDYLPNIYYSESDFEVGVQMYDLMCYNEAHQNKHPNIILSTDLYLFQLVSMVENTHVFRPKKSNQYGDISYVVSANNLLRNYFSQRMVKTPDYIDQIHPSLYSLLLTLSRCPERSLKAFFNVPHASEIIYSGISGHKIFNGYNSNIENIWSSLYDNSFDKYSFDLFERRFKCIDILSQYIVYLNTNHKKINLVDYVDPDSIRALNDKYFKQYPLDLNLL